MIEQDDSFGVSDSEGGDSIVDVIRQYSCWSNSFQNRNNEICCEEEEGYQV